MVVPDAKLEAVPTAGVRPAPFQLGYRRGLDGLRGVSILAVVGDHARLIPARAGTVGVDVFFVLSGFLITSLLIEEWEQSHRISLKKFYWRRALRLLPALCVALAVIDAYTWLFISPSFGILNARDALTALFYSSNWVHIIDVQRPGIFGHTWTLSIEEQFYLIWPLVLLWLLRRTSSRQSLLRWIVLGIFLSEMARIVLTVLGASWIRVYCGTDTRADALLIGCALSVIFSSAWVPRAAWFEKLIKFLAWIGAAALAGLCFYEGFTLEFDLFVVWLCMSIFAALVIAEVVLSETSSLSRILNSTPLVYLGRVSYGLYVWHHPIFILVQAHHWPRLRELAIEMPLAVAATLASYFLLEKPLLRFKRKFQPVVTARI